MDTDTNTARAPWSLDRIAGHDCFDHAGPDSAKRARVECGRCLTTWSRHRNPWIWVAQDLECDCGARASSEDTSIEWHSDTECHRCHAKRTEGAA